VGEKCDLSVTKCYTILATLYESKLIQEYTTNWSLIREIRLDDSINNPQHCVQLSNGHFVVCHTGSAQHRVCIVDASGHILHSYGRTQGSGIGHLNHPCQVAVDIDDNVLVVDQFNDRVQLLGPSLIYLGDTAIPGYMLESLSCIYYDELSHRLYIGQWTEETIFVLNVQM